jgi:hypothetical protein
MLRLSALRAGHPLSPGRFLVLISVRVWVDPKDSAAGRIRSIEKSVGLIGDRTHDLSACSIVPQPTNISNKVMVSQAWSSQNLASLFVLCAISRKRSRCKSSCDLPPPNVIRLANKHHSLSQTVLQPRDIATQLTVPVFYIPEPSDWTLWPLQCEMSGISSWIPPPLIHTAAPWMWTDLSDYIQLYMKL